MKATFRMTTVCTAHGLKYSTDHTVAPTLQVVYLKVSSQPGDTATYFIPKGDVSDIQ